MLIFSSPWLPPSCADIPTWIKAVATIGLLIGAIITARYAIKASRAQSEQLADQRKINYGQTKVLELQAQELSASLKALEQASLELRYQYAWTIVVCQDEPYPAIGGWTVIAHIKNTGTRPIRDVSARWYRNG